MAIDMAKLSRSQKIDVLNDFLRLRSMTTRRTILGLRCCFRILDDGDKLMLVATVLALWKIDGDEKGIAAFDPLDSLGDLNNMDQMIAFVYSKIVSLAEDLKAKIMESDALYERVVRRH